MSGGGGVRPVSCTVESCHLVTQGSWKSKSNKEAPTENEAEKENVSSDHFFPGRFSKKEKEKFLG